MFSSHLLYCSVCCRLSESLHSVVSVLSQVESDGEVGANPTAAAASGPTGSGINPVSEDTVSAPVFL